MLGRLSFSFLSYFFISTLITSCGNEYGTGGMVSTANIPKVSDSELEGKCSYVNTQVEEVVINDGYAQRSRLLSLKIKFDRIVPLPANIDSMIELRHQATNNIVNLLSDTIIENGKTIVLLHFIGGSINGPAAPFLAPYSLKDGIYNINVMLSHLSPCENKYANDFVMLGDTVTNKLFALYADADGDADVDVSDFVSFRLLFGTSLLPSQSLQEFPLDWEGDGDVDVSDFLQLRLRFGTSL